MGAAIKRQRKKKENQILKDICISVLLTALFIIAKTLKQTKCPSTDEWIKKMWHIYTHNRILLEYYSAIKKNGICSNTDGPRDQVSEVS